MKYIFLIFATLLIFFKSFGYAQQTYNMEVIFHAECPLDSAETFGIALSSAGDINNDGFDDIIIGSRAVIWVGAQDTSPGHAYIYYGGSLIDTIVDISLLGEHPLDLFGLSVCGLGDINCDGIDDIAVGAPNCAQIDSCGRVYIYFGGSLMDSIPDIILKGTWCGGFGCAVAHGDINGDGWNDIVVGECGPGRVYIYYGGPLLDIIPDIVLSGIYSFGRTVGSGGDLNSDGFDDIVVGEDENSEAYPGAGKITVYFGGNPMDTIPDCWLHGEGVNHYLGWFNCDIVKNQSDYDRILTGTEEWPNGFMSANPGKIYVMNGNSTMDTLVDWWTAGKADTSFLGVWSTQAGNADNNEYYDILSGAPGITAQYVGGIGYLWLGDSAIDTIPDGWMGSNDYKYYSIGFRVASAGDVNGDGYDAVIFSNYPADSNQTVWVCRYTGPGVEEQRTEGIAHIMALTVYPTIFTDKLVIKCQIPNAKYQMNAKAQMSLKIYDILGREVMKYDYAIDNTEGNTVADVDARNLAAGVYFVEVEAEGMREVRKVIKIE